MLGRNYRYQIYNGTNVSVTCEMTGRDWKFGTDGSLTHSTEATKFATASIGTLSYSNSTTNDNSSSGYIGSHLNLIMTPASSATGTVALYLQRSTDGGSNWPSNGLGEFVGAHYFSASATAVTKNLSVD